MISFIGNFEVFFLNGYLIAHLQQDMRTPVVLHPHQHLVFSFFLVFTILRDV